MNEQPALSPTQLHKSSKEGEAEAGEMTNRSHWPSCPRLGTGVPTLKHTHCSSLTSDSSTHAHATSSCPEPSPSTFPFSAPLLLWELSASPSSTLFPAEFCAYPLFTQAGTPQDSTQSSYFPWLLAPGRGSVNVCGANEQASPACLSPSLTAKCSMGIPRPFHPVPPSAISLANV